MFSFQKLAVFGVVVAVLWLGFRFVRTLEKRNREQERMAGKARRGWFSRRFRNSPARRARRDVDTVACDVCGAYVAVTGSGTCGRADCPWPLDPCTTRT